EDELPVLDGVGGRVGVGLDDADARLAVLRDRLAEVHADELVVVAGLWRDQAAALGHLAADHLERQLLAGGAVLYALLRRDRAAADRVEEQLRSLPRLRHVVDDRELVAFRREEVVHGEVVLRQEREREREREDGDGEPPHRCAAYCYSVARGSRCDGFGAWKRTTATGSSSEAICIAAMRPL